MHALFAILCNACVALSLARTDTQARVKVRVRFGTPSPRCSRLSSLQDSVRYHADAVSMH